MYKQQDLKECDIELLTEITDTNLTNEYVKLIENGERENLPDNIVFETIASKNKQVCYKFYEVRNEEEIEQDLKMSKIKSLNSISKSLDGIHRIMHFFEILTIVGMLIGILAIFLVFAR